MLQAVQIETQAEQQGLAHLGAQRTTGCASRELALHRTEQAFDQGSASVEASRERPPHLRAHSVDAPGFLSALGGDYTQRAELLPDVGVIPLAVELGVGQNQADARFLPSGLDHRRQVRAVVPRSASRDLRQHELLSSGRTGRQRNSKSYTLERRVEPLVMASEITGLADLHGYLKKGNLVVRVNFPFIELPAKQPKYIERPLKTKPKETPQTTAATVEENGTPAQKLTPQKIKNTYDHHLNRAASAQQQHFFE